MDRESFEVKVLERLAQIETKLDRYDKFENQSTEAFSLSRENEKEINEIKDKIKWLSRTVTTALIGLIVEIIVFVIKMM